MSFLHQPIHINQGFCCSNFVTGHFDGLVQERRNSSALATMKLDGDSLMPENYGCHFDDDTFKCIFLKKKKDLQKDSRAEIHVETGFSESSI